MGSLPTVAAKSLWDAARRPAAKTSEGQYWWAARHGPAPREYLAQRCSLSLIGALRDQLAEENPREAGRVVCMGAELRALVPEIVAPNLKRT